MLDSTFKQAHYDALLNADRRFDGKVFVAVKTTGIYCRPICPGRPKPENLQFFPNHFEAEKRGYQPCLRCLPERAPKNPWPTKISNRLALAFNVLSLDPTFAENESSLAQHCGLSLHELQRAFQDIAGLSIREYQILSRLDFSRTLLRETILPIPEIAKATGYSSSKAFEDAFLLRFRRTPLQIPRRKQSGADSTEVVTIPLAYRPPFDWDQFLAFYSTHRTPGLETISGNTYTRLLGVEESIGQVKVFPHPSSPSELKLKISGVPPSSLMTIVNRMRWMLDLDLDPMVVSQTLSSQQHLADLIKRWPGLRHVKGWDGFGTAVATVLGQLVSVSFGRVLLKELIDAYGEKVVDPATGETHILFPTPKRLRKAKLSEIRTTDARRASIRGLADLAHRHPSFFSLPQLPEKIRKELSAVSGIGPWTIEYIALRAFGDPDAFPATDYGLKQELADRPKLDVKTLRPMRAYAATYLWRAFAERKETRQ